MNGSPVITPPQLPGEWTTHQLVQRVRGAIPSLTALYLFGSRACGQGVATSDLDLAVLYDGPLRPVAENWMEAQRLASALKVDVDLVDLRTADTVMQYQIITTGTRLWATSLAPELFECFVLSEKTNLDEARAPLLADIARSGSIGAPSATSLNGRHGEPSA